MNKQWIIHNPDFQIVRQITEEIRCHPVVSSLLAKRGLISTKDILDFLNPSLDQMRSFNAFVDLPKALQRMAHAIFQKEPILVFGDYDVDGITATAMLYDFLKRAGAEVFYYIPDRISEGYGLNPGQIDALAVPRHVRLIITVDCGSSSHEAVHRANEVGIDVIITDHHSITKPYPNAYAIINPKRPDCPSQAGYYAGVGVAFCVLIGLRKYLREFNYWNAHSQPNLKDYCDLVALGTISDMAPMIHENRIITKTGLDVMNKHPRIGIKALKEISGLQKPFLDPEDIAFRIGPRINAAGRMDHAKSSLELLLAKDLAKALELAQKLNALNQLRQKEETIILNDIDRFLKDDPSELGKKALVLAGHDLHEGVLGIVAARLVEKFYRPVFLVSLKGDLGKGSGRSIPGIDLFDAVKSCSAYLENFGGHPMAAGIRIQSHHYRQFKEAFEKTIARMWDQCNPRPFLEIDAELSFDMISEKLMDGIHAFQPFGPENPEPVFISKNIEVVFSKIIGNDHIQFYLKQKMTATSPIFPAVWFHGNKDFLQRKHLKEIAYKVRKNHWNGAPKIQLLIEDIR